jgi:hypothetical protein
MNPIEKAFSKLKALLRKAAERTVDALWDRIGLLLKEFSPTECANFFAAAGPGSNTYPARLVTCASRPPRSRRRPRPWTSSWRGAKIEKSSPSFFKLPCCHVPLATARSPEIA